MLALNLIKVVCVRELYLLLLYIIRRDWRTADNEDHSSTHFEYSSILHFGEIGIDQDVATPVCGSLDKCPPRNISLLLYP